MNSADTRKEGRIERSVMELIKDRPEFDIPFSLKRLCPIANDHVSQLIGEEQYKNLPDEKLRHLHNLCHGLRVSLNKATGDISRIMLDCIPYIVSQDVNKNTLPKFQFNIEVSFENGTPEYVLAYRVK